MQQIPFCYGIRKLITFNPSLKPAHKIAASFHLCSGNLHMAYSPSWIVGSVTFALRFPQSIKAWYLESFLETGYDLLLSDHCQLTMQYHLPILFFGSS
jgi:hypothetical protein